MTTAKVRILLETNLPRNPRPSQLNLLNPSSPNQPPTILFLQMLASTIPIPYDPSVQPRVKLPTVLLPYLLPSVPSLPFPQPRHGLEPHCPVSRHGYGPSRSLNRSSLFHPVPSVLFFIPRRHLPLHTSCPRGPPVPTLWSMA